MGDTSRILKSEIVIVINPLDSPKGRGAANPLSQSTKRCVGLGLLTVIFLYNMLAAKHSLQQVEPLSQDHLQGPAVSPFVNTQTHT